MTSPETLQNPSSIPTNDGGEATTNTLYSKQPNGASQSIDYRHLTDVFDCVNRELDPRQQKMGRFREMGIFKRFLRWQLV